MCADWRRFNIAFGLLAALASNARAQDRSPPALVHAAAQAASGPAAAVPSATVAALAPASATAATADELTRLQDQTIVLEARLKELEARQAVETKLRALKGTAAPSLGNVRVIAVERMGATRIATVRLSDGSEFEAVPGDTLIDGARIASIGDGVVNVRLHSGRFVRLRVGGGDGGEPETVPSAGQANRGIPGNPVSSIMATPRFQGQPE